MRHATAVLSVVLPCLALVRPANAEGPATPPRPPDVPVAAPAARRVSSALARGAVLSALHAARVPERYAELASLSSRARSAAVLPEVWLRASRSTDQSLRLTPTVDDPARYTEAGGAGVWLEARLVWHLDRLVFDREELSVARLASEQRDAASKLTAKVLATLFDWQRALAAETDANGPEEARESAAFRRMEAEVLLDVMTAGWFGRQITGETTRSP